jgi:hypothetical protein
MEFYSLLNLKDKSLNLTGALTQWEEFYNRQRSILLCKAKHLGKDIWKLSIKYLPRSRYGSCTPKEKKIS